MNITMKRKPENSLYVCWCNMMARCKNPNNKEYKNYGERGIDVCNDWRDYDSFAVWAVANGYEDGLQLDRTDNEGDYSPANCRFITRKENCRNTRCNIHLTINGETRCLAECAEMIGKRYCTVKSWLYRHGKEYAEGKITAYLTGVLPRAVPKTGKD